MTCAYCIAARETLGAHRLHDPRCMYCGARLIQLIPHMCDGIAAWASQRRRDALAVWVAQGHDEAEIRELVAGPMAFEPVRGRKVAA
jgi:hypothetical protein